MLDTLDECDDFDDVRFLLRLFGDAPGMENLGLRLLVTCRPETPIQLSFQGVERVQYHELALHDLPRYIVDREIKDFVAHELSRIKADRRLLDS